MNQFDIYIVDFLLEKKSVTLDKIGELTVTGITPEQENQILSLAFTSDKKATTSPELIDFIAGKIIKNRNLVASDIESYLSQVREYINIGKTYEVSGAGFIKANKQGVYEFFPYSDVNKPVKINSPQVQQKKKGNNRSVIQLVTFLIVIAILAGLGWQAYQFFSRKDTANNVDTTVSSNADIVLNNTGEDTVANKLAPDTTSQSTIAYAPTDTLNVRYIFETTSSLSRAEARTSQLKSFGNVASFDSTVTDTGKTYSLFIVKSTKVSDTLRIRDSIAKFLQKPIKIKVAPK